MYFSRDEFESRWTATHAEMTRRGYDTAVVWQRTGGSYDRAGDVWYLSNYASLNVGQEQQAFGVGGALAALLLRVGHAPQLHILDPGGSDIEHVDSRYCAVDDIVTHPDNLATGFAGYLVKEQIEGRVAYVGDDFLPADMYRWITTGTPGIEWVPETDLLYRQQRHPSPREQDLYREFGAISAEALTALMESLVTGHSQSEAAAEAAAIIVRNGGGYQRIGMATGRSGDEHAFDYPLYGFSRHVTPAVGDLVRAWVVPVFEGYWFDPGRTAVCGRKPTSTQKLIIEQSVDIVERVIAEVKPGRTPREVGRIVDGYCADKGYPAGETLGLYGHGLSTFWAGPIIPAGGIAPAEPTWDVDEPFFEGQLFTSETHVVHPDAGNAGLEQLFIVHESGNEVVTPGPMTFW